MSELEYFLLVILLILFLGITLVNLRIEESLYALI